MPLFWECNFPNQLNATARYYDYYCCCSLSFYTDDTNVKYYDKPAAIAVAKATIALFNLHSQDILTYAHFQSNQIEQLHKYEVI